MRALLFILSFTIATPALAQCPPAVAGSTAAEIRQNEQRLACLQRELSAETERRQLDIEIDMLSQRLRTIETQRQFDALDFFIPAPVVPLP